MTRQRVEDSSHCWLCVQVPQLFHFVPPLFVSLLDRDECVVQVIKRSLSRRIVIDRSKQDQCWMIYVGIVDVDQAGKQVKLVA